MKKLYFLIPVLALAFAACTKRDYIPAEVDVRQWMRTHDRGVVAYIDYSTGNYIVDTYEGYSVVESWDRSMPIENDHTYAYFNSRGVQSIYNVSGDYFSKGRVVDHWLTWNEAIWLLDDLKWSGR